MFEPTTYWLERIELGWVLGVSENSDETPEHELKESQNVQIHG
jgi:hypothetical protein